MTDQKKASVQKQDFISLQDLLYLCLNKWYWFIISLAVCLSCAIFYLLKTPPVYTRTASILIKDDSQTNKGGTSNDVSSSFSNLGLFSATKNVNDEIGTLQSPDLMRQVVERLQLNIKYTTSAGLHQETLYGKNLPITVSFGNLPVNSTAGFALELFKGGKIKLYDFIKDGNKYGNETVISGRINTPLQTPLGTITIFPTNYYKTDDTDKINITHSTIENAVNSFANGLTVVQNDEKSNIITLSFKDLSTQRAEAILNSLIQVYNENWIKDKNRMAISTSTFINNRLMVIEKELGNVDNDISSFKSANLLPDVQTAAQMYMDQANNAETSVKDLNNQAYMIHYIQRSLVNNQNKYQLLPANPGIDNPALINQINEYNNQLLERNSLIAQSSNKNPLVAEMDAALAGMRSALIHSVNNQLVAINEQIKSFKDFSGQATSKIASNPKQAKYLLSVERQQKVKESLYLYLLQKREENELSQAFTAYNTRVISMPDGSMSPTSPVKKNILLMAFAIGLVLPAIIILIRENMNTEIRGRKDLENVDVPFAGELPLAGKKKCSLLKRKSKHEKPKVVVQEEGRNIINEAFRVLRTNLEFMQSGTNSHVIMITSANSGSGKTFITFNLSAIMAIKGKKVIAIDLDLRKRSLSKYLGHPKNGISLYLSGHSDMPEIQNYKISKNCSFDVIPVGIMPPNPTELLSSDRLQTLLNKLRSEYDYIFIDCPPVEIVADADIINKFVDMTLFVIRAGLLDRSMLPIIEKYYTDHKYKNLAIVLNGSDYEGSRYGYKYGYKYGYHYGYSY